MNPTKKPSMKPHTKSLSEPAEGKGPMYGWYGELAPPLRRKVPLGVNAPPNISSSSSSAPTPRSDSPPLRERKKRPAGVVGAGVVVVAAALPPTPFPPPVMAARRRGLFVLRFMRNSEYGPCVDIHSSSILRRSFSISSPSNELSLVLRSALLPSVLAPPLLPLVVALASFPPSRTLSPNSISSIPSSPPSSFTLLLDSSCSKSELVDSPVSALRRDGDPTPTPAPDEDNDDDPPLPLTPVLTMSMRLSRNRREARIMTRRRSMYRSTERAK
mmetsp:Transcript_33092/g.71517  ORF Transcript_33092/g.71517 Transcript_33092/m.71517 type:complete len:272 (-) Transcript_33092:689-1504(-)